MSKAVSLCAAALLVVTLGVLPGMAQRAKERNDQPAEPLSPLAPSESSSRASQRGETPASEIPENTGPDTRPLSGGQELSFGVSNRPRNFLLSGVKAMQLIDTNSFGTAGAGKLTVFNHILGHAALERTTGRSQFTLRYTGGGSISNNRSELNSFVQVLGVSDQVSYRRWTLLFEDQFSQLPESSFGFSGLTGFDGAAGPAGVLGGDPGNIQSVFMPNQSILTGRRSRISNTVLGQAEYQLSRRASVTFLGSYGLLHFADVDLLDVDNSAFQTGFDYELTSRDSVAVLYRFNAFRFTGLGGAVDNHIVQVAYGRRLVGRLTSRFAVGSEVDVLDQPGIPSVLRATWNIDTSLRYRLRASEFAFSYRRGLTGGAGLFFGAVTNSVDASWGRRLGRVWSGAIGTGFARNESLGLLSASATRRLFRTWFGRAEITRPVGRHGNFLLAYTVQFQNDNALSCGTVNCLGNVARHQVSIGFNWNFRPIRID